MDIIFSQQLNFIYDKGFNLHNIFNRTIILFEQLKSFLKFNKLLQISLNHW